MSIEIKVPQLPESVADATLVTWHKQAGQAVTRDENLADLETDKVVLEVPAPVSGVLQGTAHRRRYLGDQRTGARGARRGCVLPAARARRESRCRRRAAPRKPRRPRRPPPRTTTASSRLRCAAWSKRSSSTLRRSRPPAAMAASPRVMSWSIWTSRRPRPRRPAASPLLAPAPARSGAAGRQDQRVPMTRLRARIAERLLEAQHTQALLTTFNEVDLKAVMDLRAKYKDSFEKKHGVKLGFMSFFVKAAVEALKKFPTVNASIEGNDIVYHEYYDIGVAVSTEKRPHGPGVARRGPAELRRHREEHRCVRGEGARRQDHHRRSDRRHVHHHQRRHLRFADVHAHRQHAAERDPRHAQAPRSVRWWSTARS